MPQKLLEGAQHFLTYAEVQNTTDASLVPFLNACGSNDAALALQLAPDRDAGALTYGLNRAAAFCTPEIFALLLSYGANILNAIPLHYAAGISREYPRGPSIPPNIVPGSRVPMLEYLVGLGLDVNAMDDAIKIADDGRG